ncbi:MAG TPA: MarR family transcriptional regulator [Acidimicrobiales bacterium]|nr:MarR family transcriptional regulator [Acidimicrobiales bacterium]
MKSAMVESERSIELAARLRLVMVRLTRALRHQGSTTLSPSQVSALASVDEYGPLRISALAALESVGAPVATRVVASLEELDLLKRTEDPEDKRASLVELSDHGRTVLPALWRQRTIGLCSRLEQLSPAERSRLELALPALEKLARENYLSD